MEEKVIQNANQFLTGGGEMGALIRAKDWSQTPVGDPETWPQSLRTTLSIILNSRFPMFLWWGPDLLCFYNDAYRPSLGRNGKHPYILGMKAETAWTEIWDTIDPLIKSVLDGGDVWMEDQLIPIYRNGDLEDVYWTFSYSPVKDESGQIAGVLVTCMETTGKVQVFTEIQERENQLNFTIDAAEVATWDLNPLTNKFIGNDSLKEWFGLNATDEIPLPQAFERIIEKDRQRVIDAIQKALTPASKGHYEIEYTIVNPATEEERTVLAKGKALFDELSRPYRFSGILQDVTQRTQGRKKLEQSEKRFRNTVLQAPVGIAIFRGENFLVELANEMYLQIVGKEETAFVGKPLFDSLPEVRESVEVLLTNVLHTGVPYHGREFPVMLNVFGVKRVTYFNFVYQALRDNGVITGVIVLATDVTASVKAKEALAESERQFRNLIMQSPIPMTIFRGRDHVIETANTVMIETIWRRKEVDLIGKKILDVFPELKEQKYAELLDHVYKTGLTHHEKESLAYVQGDDGMRRFYLDFEYAPLFDTDGSVSGLIVTVSDVTEKVEARKKVEESEVRFRNIANTAPVLIWMANPNKLCNFFNRAWLSFTGRTMEQELGNGWVEGVHSDDLQRCLYTYVTAFDKQEEFYMEFRLKRNDGTYRWISNHGVPRLSLEGTFEGYIGACMDIHERISYQKKLKEDEERLNIVIDASELGIWELNLTTMEVNYSDRYLEIFGYKQKVQLTHEQLLKHLHPDDMWIRDKAFKKSFATGVLHYESRIIWNDKSIHWMEGKGKVFYEGKKPSLMIGTVRDITKEKLFQQQLQAREEKFRLLAESMPQKIWTCDAVGNPLYFNKAVHEYTGLTPEQAIAGGLGLIMHPDDLEMNLKGWEEAMNTGKEFLIEHRFRRYDGVYRWQLTRAVAQRDETGTIQMWVGTSTDIQEQKTFTNELERQVLERTSELKQKNKDLEKMNSELQSFAYISSHDLQEPLRKIQIFANRVLEKEQDVLSENGKSYFSGIQRAASRMQTLIEDLLAYSRTNNTEKIFKITDLNELILEVKNDFKETLAQKNGTIELDEVCKANVIPFQIRQLFLNLIGNSIKFSDSARPLVIRVKCELVKGEKLNIEALAPEKTYCHISISDNGIGFDPQYRDRIFEVFQRLHGKDEYSGTGIGLSIVKKIVDNHGGIIVASGTLNVGATFDIYFPA